MIINSATSGGRAWRVAWFLLALLVYKRERRSDERGARSPASGVRCLTVSYPHSADLQSREGARGVQGAREGLWLEQLRSENRIVTIFHKDKIKITDFT